MRVLVVSENEMERLRATTGFAARDVEIVEATSSREARERVNEESFDVLVIDGDMAPKGGFSLLYELREGGELRGEATAPALVMLGREEDRWLAGWAGANEVMLKPVDPFVLADRVAGLAGADPAPPGARESGSHVDAVLARAGREPGEARD